MGGSSLNLLLNIESATCSSFVKEMITSRSVSSFHCVALITIDETELRIKQGMDGDDCIAQFDMFGIVQGNNPT